MAPGSRGAVGRAGPLVLINCSWAGDYGDGNWLSVGGMLGLVAQPWRMGEKKKGQDVHHDPAVCVYHHPQATRNISSVLSASGTRTSPTLLQWKGLVRQLMRGVVLVAPP